MAGCRNQAAKVDSILAGKELGTGKALAMYIAAGSTTGLCTFYDATYPSANSNILAISGSYEGTP